MSRGPGRLQRAILEKLAAAPGHLIRWGPEVVLPGEELWRELMVSIFPAPRAGNDHTAFRRAMLSLLERGLVAHREVPLRWSYANAWRITPAGLAYVHGKSRRGTSHALTPEDVAARDVRIAAEPRERLERFRAACVDLWGHCPFPVEGST